MYQDELQLARSLAVQAGSILTRYFGTRLIVESKGWADPVTAADKESEAFIRSGILSRYPTDGIDGEEEGRRPGSSGRMWLIDPLDGTANFAGGFPLFAVCITLIDESDPDNALLNVTYDPIRQEMFHAIKGEGAFLDGGALHVSALADLSSALVHISFSNQRLIWPTTIDLVRRLTEFAPHARDIGSSALGQAYVAAGRLDAHMKVTSGMYDVVGGNLLIVEAGGVVSNLDGEAWGERGSLCSATPGLPPLLIGLTQGMPRPVR